uniref:Uncharacterized protein n=1 Tax=Cyclopterus lumpus TaxID=8103 RepID=A0A8C2WIW5_CYCLU
MTECLQYQNEHQPKEVLTFLSFSRGISNAHLNFESISSSGFASFHCGQEHREERLTGRKGSYRDSLVLNSFGTMRL